MARKYAEEGRPPVMEGQIIAQIRKDGLVYAYVGSQVAKQNVSISPANLHDLHQEGELGALIAVRKYDPLHESGAGYVTFASRYMEKFVKSALRKLRYVVHIPDGQHDSIARIARVMGAPGSDQLPDQDVAKAARVTPKTYRHLKDVANYRTDMAIPVVSRDEDDSFSQTAPRAYTVELVDSFDPAAAYEAEETALEHAILVHRLLSGLPVQERLIVAMKFGLLDQPPLPLPDISTQLNLPVTQVRATWNRAMRALKRTVKRDNISRNS